MDLGAEEELSSEPSELQELARAQDGNFARLARTFQSGMESLATTRKRFTTSGAKTLGRIR